MPWDIAAGALLVREAGGEACRIDGAPLDLMVGDVLACAPRLAAELGREVAEFLRDVHWAPRRYTPAASAQASPLQKGTIQSE